MLHSGRNGWWTQSIQQLYTAPPSQPAAIALHDMQISLCIVNNVEVDDDKSLFGESFCNGKVHCNAAV